MNNNSYFLTVTYDKTVTFAAPSKILSVTLYLLSQLRTSQ